MTKKKAPTIESAVGFTSADIELLTQLCLVARELSRDQFRAADNLAGRIKALLPEHT